MTRTAWILSAMMAAAVVLVEPASASGECRRICRKGEVRNAQRCCVRAKRRPAFTCRRGNWRACERTTARLLSRGRSGAAAKILARTCSMKAPRLVRGRACPVFAQLIVDGSVAVPKRATRRSYAMMLLQRGCRGFQRKARCGDPDVDGVFSPFDDCPTLKGYDDTAGCPVPGHTIATFPFRANQAETDPKIVAYRIKTTVKALRDNPKLGVVLVRGSAMKGESYRRRLALMRAQHVRRLLVSAGAAKHRLVVGAHDGSVTQVSVVVAAKSVPAKLTTEQMLSATKQLRALSRRCTDPATAAWGSSLVRYWINPDGRVTNVRVSGAAKGNATGMCLEKILRAYRYPRSKSGQPSSLSVRKGRGL